MKKLFTCLVVIFLTVAANAQQDAMLSQYMFNHLAINPGYAGSKNYMMATLLHRKQWVGFDGAPESQLLSLHGPVQGRNLGLGGTIFHDHIGVTNRTDVYGHVAYHLPINHYVKLGFGLQGGLSHYTYKNSDLIYWDASDRVFSQATQTGILPNVGAGAFLYSKKFYLGLSAPHLIEYNKEHGMNGGLTSIKPNQVRHYFFEGGLVCEVNPELVIRPSFLVKYVNGAPAEADINLNVLLASTVWVGGSYRTNDAAVALLELQVNKKLRVGYAYDFTMTHMKYYSSGSHEIMIGYDFGYDITRIKTPRYF